MPLVWLLYVLAAFNAIAWVLRDGWLYWLAAMGCLVWGVYIHGWRTALASEDEASA